MFETIITVSIAILLALVIVELSLPYYNEFLNKELIIYGSQFYGQLILIFIVTVICAGVFPAIYVSNFETLKVLKGNFGRNKSGVWLRNGMLILQFAIASFFIIGSCSDWPKVSTFLDDHGGAAMLASPRLEDATIEVVYCVLLSWYKIVSNKTNQPNFIFYKTPKFDILFRIEQSSVNHRFIC